MRAIQHRLGTEKYWNFIFIIAFLFTVGLCSAQSSIDSTKNTDAAAVNEDSAIPDFILSTIKDSTDFRSTSLSKNGIVLIKYFSPDCDHCQEEAEMFVSKKDSLQNVETIWVSGSWASLKMITEFAEEYQLEKLSPIAIGKETEGDRLLTFYKLTGVPFAAVYKDNQLIKEYRGSLDFSELIAINNGTFKP